MVLKTKDIFKIKQEIENYFRMFDLSNEKLIELNEALWQIKQIEDKREIFRTNLVLKYGKNEDTEVKVIPKYTKLFNEIMNEYDELEVELSYEKPKPEEIPELKIIPKIVSEMFT